MRLSTLAPLAFVASLATFAAAYSAESYEYEYVLPCLLFNGSFDGERSRARGDYDLYARDDYARMYARSNDGLYLAARDLNTVTLLARDLLYARMDRPRREHYATQEQYEKAFKAWNRHNGEILRDYQNTLAKHPHAGGPQPSDPNEWKKWAQDNRHVVHHVQDTIHHQAHEHHKDIQRIEKGKDPKCKKRRGSKCVVS